MARNKLVIILFLCLLLAGINACKRKEQKEGPAKSSAQEIQVHIYIAAEETTPSLSEVAGTLEAVDYATISAKVSGVVDELPVSLGSTVKKGEVLLRIKADEISARVAQAKTNLDQARRNLEREKRLLAKNAVTRESVKTLEESLQIAEAAYNEAKTYLSYTTLIAPFNGIIAAKMVNRGDLATVGAPLLTLTDNATMQAVCHVPETFLPKIRTGDDLSVIIPAAGVETLGSIKEIAPVADAQSRTALVKLRVDKTENLRPGQFARVFLPGKVITSLYIPEEAVAYYGQMEKVFVAEDSFARLRLVRTGSHTDGKVEILSGLNQGERVIIPDTNATLMDGQPIRIIQ